MKLFLSSQDLGEFSNEFLALVGERRKIAIINNAKDFYEKESRQKSYLSRKEMFEGLGFEVFEIDLRNFFGRRGDLKRLIEVQNPSVIWLTGGEPQLLNYAMKTSGLDEIIIEGVKNNSFVAGGFSAGAMVFCRSLENYWDESEHKKLVNEIYGADFTYDCLNLFGKYIIPHQNNADFAADAQRIKRKLEIAGVEFVCLKDSEAIIIKNDEIKIHKTL